MRQATDDVVGLGAAARLAGEDGHGEHDAADARDRAVLAMRGDGRHVWAGWVRVTVSGQP